MKHSFLVVMEVELETGDVTLGSGALTVLQDQVARGVELSDLEQRRGQIIYVNSEMDGECVARDKRSVELRDKFFGEKEG